MFLWGPRRTGKTYWIRQHLAGAPVIDLLNTDAFAEYASRPALLRERFSASGATKRRDPIVIDEVQKLPVLLDEVHWLIENRKLTFLLTGSSARKLRRGHANLFAGRARRREMRPLCFPEIGRLVLERVAAITSSELLNYTNVARDVGVSARVARGYFDLLEDTMIGFRVAPWTKSPNRRTIQTPKLCLFDVGIANHLARRRPAPGTPEFGKSVEHLVLMELQAFRSYRSPDLDIRYWRTSTGQEVDFVLNDFEVAIEVKASARVADAVLEPLVARSSRMASRSTGG